MVYRACCRGASILLNTDLNFVVTRLNDSDSYLEKLGGANDISLRWCHFGGVGRTINRLSSISSLDTKGPQYGMTEWISDGRGDAKRWGRLSAPEDSVHYR